MKRQPSRWSKSFWRKKEWFSQNAHFSTPSAERTPSKLAVYALPHFAHVKSPASVTACSRAVRQSAQ